MSSLNNTPFPVLITNRLVLRKLDKGDDNAIFELRSNHSINQFINRIIATSIDQAQDFIARINNNIIKNESLYWAVTLKDNTNVIGTICLYNFTEDNSIAELGYELHPIHQGLGIMQEAIKAVISYAFNTIKLKEIDAYTHKENINSTKLLLKNGFVVNEHKFDPEEKDIIVYSLKSLTE